MEPSFPAPGKPMVEFIEENLARWRFASTDCSIQEVEFHYWRGYFGFEEDDEPEDVGGNVWFVRRRPSTEEGV